MAISLIFFLGEFLRFIRVETCFFISSIAASGYLLFNSLNPGLLHVVMAMFFLSAAGYGCNHLTDRKEDIINNSRLNFFANRKAGILIVGFLITAGIASALLLMPLSVTLYMVSIPAIMSYSILRIKKVFIVKNVYTGLVITLAFLIGTQAGPHSIFSALSYAAFVFIFGFLLNLLGDIRGHEGDLVAGVKTIPGIFGIGKAKVLVYSISTGFLVALISSNRAGFFPLIPFVFLISLFLFMDKHKHARASILSSFPSLPFMIMFLKLGVV